MLYFILLLKSKGINVDEVYENEVKAIETERFQKFMTGDEHNLTQELQNESKDDIEKVIYSMYSDDSYELIA